MITIKNIVVLNCVHVPWNSSCILLFFLFLWRCDFCGWCPGYVVLKLPMCEYTHCHCIKI
jgi:hypothetical protein